jgi:hypothetical protein
LILDIYLYILCGAYIQQANTHRKMYAKEEDERNNH